jgi:signal transduction histidine kinase
LLDGSRDVYVTVLPVLAEVRLRRAGQAEGTRTLDEAFAFIRSDSTLTPVSRRNFFKQASALREQLGQYEEAMADWRRWQREDSTIHARDDRASLATLKIMLDNDQRLLDERADRERALARLALDREQRRIMVSAALISALLLLGVLLLYAGRRRNVRRMATLERDRSQGRKELAELRVRQRLSEEMHQELGAGLDALKLRSELALEVEQQPADQERLARIVDQAGELIGSLRQIIWALDTGRSSLQETVQYTAHYARTYTTQQGLQLIMRLDDDWPDIQLTMEQRRNCFLVVKEALHNVVKHAHATAVEFRMTMMDDLVVEIMDDGRGMPAALDAKGGNGVRNMRNRIEAIGGRLVMEQRNGTIIRFVVPAIAMAENLRSTPTAQR